MYGSLSERPLEQTETYLEDNQENMNSDCDITEMLLVTTEAV